MSEGNSGVATSNALALVPTCRMVPIDYVLTFTNRDGETQTWTTWSPHPPVLELYQKEKNRLHSAPSQYPLRPFTPANILLVRKRTSHGSSSGLKGSQTNPKGGLCMMRYSFKFYSTIYLSSLTNICSRLNSASRSRLAYSNMQHLSSLARRPPLPCLIPSTGNR